MKAFILRVLVLVTLAYASAPISAAEPAATRDIGSRRELFVDDWLIESISGKAELRLHHPTPQNVALETSEPWEGNATNYVTVFQDGDKYRMYYRGSHASYLGGKDRPSTRDLYCYAESPDGIHWAKPNLGLFEWNGSKQNNIVWDGVGAHAFVPFKDANPLLTRGPLQGSRRRRQQARAVCLPVGRRGSLVADEPGAGDHAGGLRLAKPGVLGHRARRVSRIPSRLPRRP